MSLQRTIEARSYDRDSLCLCTRTATPVLLMLPLRHGQHMAWPPILLHQIILLHLRADLKVKAALRWSKRALRVQRALGRHLQIFAHEPIEATRRLLSQRRQMVAISADPEAPSASTRTAPLIRHTPAQGEQVQCMADCEPSLDL